MAPIAKECDYLVIGGGSGGVASARRAAGMHGAKTILIESNRLGGTCVNVGCVPKKVIWHAAAIAETIKEAKAYGFNVQETAPFDWPAFKRKRDAYIKRLNGIYERNLSNEKVEYIHGRAHLLNSTDVEVDLDGGEKTHLRAKKILIATGGHPNVPRDVPGYEHGITSDGFFELEKQPKRVAVVGAGYIAIEMAGMLNALGTDTHLFIRKDKLLRSFDPLIQDTVAKEYERLGVNLYRSSKVSRVEPDPGRDGWLKVRYTSGNRGDGELDVDCILWAIGRSPEVEDLGLDKAGVKQRHDGKGVVDADAYQNTSADNIYAIGDVCGLVELTPVAIAAGRRLSDRLFGAAKDPSLKESKLDYSYVPSVVFAHPEAGSIGLTEPEAVEKFGRENLTIYRSNFVALYYAMMDADEKASSSYKLICAGPEQKVVGLHIIGLSSSEILQGFGVAIKLGATKRDFDNCVAIHPTSAEELVTMK